MILRSLEQSKLISERGGKRGSGSLIKKLVYTLAPSNPYSWVFLTPYLPNFCRLDAYVTHDKELKSGDVSFLTPEKRNIHSFTALEDTAILDILVPNYDE